jgi:hypothetical protein
LKCMSVPPLRSEIEVTAKSEELATFPGRRPLENGSSGDQKGGPQKTEFKL